MIAADRAGSIAGAAGRPMLPAGVGRLPRHVIERRQPGEAGMLAHIGTVASQEMSPMLVSGQSASTVEAGKTAA